MNLDELRVRAREQFPRFALDEMNLDDCVFTVGAADGEVHVRWRPVAKALACFIALPALRAELLRRLRARHGQAFPVVYIAADGYAVDLVKYRSGDLH